MVLVKRDTGDQAAMSRRTILSLLGTVGGGLFSGRPAAAQGRVSVKLAEVARSQFFAPMYVALAKGFMHEQGLDVEVTTVNGGDKVGALILTGGADVALTGPEIPIYIYNSESREKPVIFCALTGTDGFFLVSRRKIDTFAWSKVSGKILGYRPGTTPQMFLEYVLKQHGVTPDVLRDGMVTNIAPAAREGAWISGVGDFGIFQEPSLSKLEKAGQLYVVASIGKEVGRADYTVFFSSRSWLEKNAATAQKWTNGIARAQDFMRTASTREIAETILPFFPGSSVEEAALLVDRYRKSGAPIWSDTPLVDRAGLERMQTIMVAGGTLPSNKVVPYASIVDTSFAQAAK